MAPEDASLTRAPEPPPKTETPADFSVIVFAASAGSVKPLLTIIGDLRPTVRAAVVILQHRAPQFPDLLLSLLETRAALRIRGARDGDVLKPGMIYVSPAGLHITIESTLRLMEGPRINAVRSSADLLFYTAARTFGGRVIGVVLSGTGTDGALGARAIVDAGGTIIAQSPGSCTYPSMPTAAAALAPAQLVLPPEAIAAALERLVLAPAARSEAPPPAHSTVGPERTGGTSVLLVDDHDMIRDGLRVLLQRERDVSLVGEATNGQAAVEAAIKLMPDVVVMDLAMPDMGGIEATRQIYAYHPSVKVIVLSAQTDLASVSRAFAAGAVGFISKQKAFDELLQAIRTIVSTGEYLGAGAV